MIVFSFLNQINQSVNYFYGVFFFNLIFSNLFVVAVSVNNMLLKQANDVSKLAVDVMVKKAWYYVDMWRPWCDAVVTWMLQRCLLCF